MKNRYNTFRELFYEYIATETNPRLEFYTNNGTLKESNLSYHEGKFASYIENTLKESDIESNYKNYLSLEHFSNYLKQIPEDQKGRPLFISLSAIERLDKILEIIYRESDIDQKPITNISISASKLFIYGFRQTPLSEVERIIEKLLNDKYIKEVSHHTGHKGYIMTYEGEIFYLDGGYKKLKNTERKRLWLQSFQTWVTVIGTGVAGIYFIKDFIKWILSFINCS